MNNNEEVQPRLCLTYNGTMYDGTMYNGTMHDGRMHNGTMHDGTMHNGTMHEGRMHNGTMHDGQYDHTFNAHCCTFYQAFLYAQNQQPAP